MSKPPDFLGVETVCNANNPLPPNRSHCSPISPTISSTIDGIQSHDSFSSISPNIPPTIDCLHFLHSLPTAPHIPHKLPMHVCSSIIANYRGNTMTTISPNHSSNYICMQFRQSFKIFLKLQTAYNFLNFSYASLNTRNHCFNYRPHTISFLPRLFPQLQTTYNFLFLPQPFPQLQTTYNFLNL